MDLLLGCWVAFLLVLSSPLRGIDDICPILWGVIWSCRLELFCRNKLKIA